MGRKRLEIKLIEDRSSRQVTFTKRRNGLFKKANELSILCDVDVALLVFSSSGKLYEFCSHGNSLPHVLERYQQHYGKADSFAAISSQTNGSFGDIRLQSDTNTEHLNTDHLNMVELVKLEKQLEAELSKTRSRKIQLMEQSTMQFCQQQEMEMWRQENSWVDEQINMTSLETGVYSSDYGLSHQLATLRWMSMP